MATDTVPNIVSGTVPYDNAHECNGLLFDVLTMLHAILDANCQDAKGLDREGLTDKRSRIDNLALQGLDKLATAINKLGI